MRLLPTIFFWCAAFTLVVPVWQAGAAAPPPAGGRAALVNGTLITAEAFANELKRVERGNLRAKRPAVVNKRQVLENLIVRELLYQEAQRLGFQASADEVAAKLAQLNARFSAGNALESILDSMGLSPDQLETQLQHGLVIEKYLEGRLVKGTPPSDDEEAFYYQDHPDQFREPLLLRLSHILVRVEPDWDQARKELGRRKIAALARRLSAGEDFATLAAEASDCYSAKNGGDLGYFLPGELSRRMEDEARNLKTGEVSGVVEDRYGLHLLKVTELRPAALPPLEKVRGRIRDRLKEEQEQQALGPLVKRLRAAAKVELLVNESEY